MEKQDLINMELHEVKQIDTHQIIRVIGGWIYTAVRLDYSQISSVFVPEA